MKREFLVELGIEAEKIDQIMAEHGKTLNPIKEENDNLATEKDNLKQEKEKLETELDNRDKQLEKLSNDNNNNEQLKEQIEALKQANEDAKKEFKKELRKQKLDFSLDKALMEANARNPITVKALLDHELIKLDDEGNLAGLSEQLEKLKESDGYLFKDEQENNNNTSTNNNNNTHIPGSRKKSNSPKDVDPYERGRQRALARFKKEEIEK